MLRRLHIGGKRFLQDYFNAMHMLFGGDVDQYDFHQVGLNFDFLSTYLLDAGFESLVRVKDFGFVQDISTTDFNGVPISLNMTAREKV